MLSPRLTYPPSLLAGTAVLLLATGLTLLGAAPETSTPAALPGITVTAERSAALVGPYQQPRWSARGRFSSNTDVYVLPTWAIFADLDYQLTVPRHGFPTHLFTQEFEIGLPYRFQLAYEHNFEVSRRHSQTTFHTIEARWAPANWGKIPLNPTLFAEYKFGSGHAGGEGEAGEAGEPEGEVEHGEADEEGEKGEGKKGGRRESKHADRLPDSLELRLLLGEQFGERVQWALNIFHEQELAGERETETGFSQALSYSVLGETLRAGVEMQFIRRTDHETRGDARYEFDLGPSLAWKPSRRTRLDVAALFGTTSDSPALKVFAVFSIDFGRAGEGELEAPVSTRNR